MIYGRYYRYKDIQGQPLTALSGSKDEDTFDLNERAGLEDESKLDAELNLEGEIDLNLQYGTDFSLKKGAVTGAGTSGITDGLKYDLIERVKLEGRIGERLFIEFDYDSERTEEEIRSEIKEMIELYKNSGGFIFRNYPDPEDIAISKDRQLFINNTFLDIISNK